MIAEVAGWVWRSQQLSTYLDHMLNRLPNQTKINYLHQTNWKIMHTVYYSASYLTMKFFL